LDEIYHPIRAAFPNNSTRQLIHTLTDNLTVKDGACTLFGVLFKRLILLLLLKY